MEGYRVTPQQQRVLSILEERRGRWTRPDQLADMLDSTPATMKVAVHRLKKLHNIHIISDRPAPGSRGWRLA